MSEDLIPTYAYVQGDFAREAVEMHVGVRMDRQGRMVYQNGGLTSSVVVTYPDEFGIVAQIEPTIRLPETAARALYDALGRYFNGHEDTRALRCAATTTTSVNAWTI